MVMNFEASCGSFIGNGRDHNEDNFYFNKKHLPNPNKGLKNPLKCSGTSDDPVLFAVFDGMGGGSNGGEAACLAGEIFSHEVKQLEELAISGKEFFLRTCDIVNRAVNAQAKKKQLGTMGTTMAALYFSQDEVVSCNVGDSKIFRIRGNQMLQISEDHTDEKILSAMGIQKKPVLLQYLGIPDTEMAIEPYASKGDWQEGDAYVICSDGVTDVVGVTEMYEAVCAHCADEAVRRILAEVDIRNGSDNATVIIVKTI